MKVKVKLILIFLLIFNVLASADTPPGDKKKKKGVIVWMTLEEAAAKIKTEPRKVFIDVYTDWCGWCKQMDKSTFTDAGVADYVNKNFYAVKLDAEGKSPITINGKTYNYIAQYRTHETALALLNGKLSYPSTVFLDEKFGIIAPVPGYIDASTFRNLLTYFKEEQYRNITFDQFVSAGKVK